MFSIPKSIPFFNTFHLDVTFHAWQSSKLHVRKHFWGNLKKNCRVLMNCCLLKQSKSGLSPILKRTETMKAEMSEQIRMIVKKSHSVLKVCW